MRSTKTRKQAPSTRFRRTGRVYLGIIAVLLLALTSYGQVPISGALLTLDVQEQTVGWHEPVHVIVAITNVTGEEISFELSEGSKYYLTFSFTDAFGGGAANFLNLGGTNASVLGAPGKVVLKPAEQFRKTVLLNEWAALKPGKTTVEAHIGTRSPRSAEGGVNNSVPNDDLPMQTASGREVRLIPSKPLTLDIGLRSEESLKKICGELGEQALAANTLERRMEAASTLRYINDNVAIPFLAEILEEGHSSLGDVAVDGLVRIYSDEAIAALIESLKTGRDEQLRGTITTALMNIERESTSEQRRSRIRAALAQK